MKILKIELLNNPILGSTTFDFTRNNGKPYDNIVFAGENGCGKTSLLNIIFDFSNMTKDKSMPQNEERIFYIQLSNDEINRFNQRSQNEKLPSDSNVFKVTITGKHADWTGITINSFDIKGNKLNSSTTPFSANQEYRDIFKTVFSTAEISYMPKTSNTVTSMEIDEDFTSSLQSNSQLASEIQQLLIDIYTNDASDLSEWVTKHPQQVPPNSIIERRISRFKKAFSRMFDNLNFEKIATSNNQKTVLFKKDGKHISIAKLSSGEKQIVFRGAFLLQRQQVSMGYPVLLDEPEISLHPLWQQRIFEFYKNLFTAGNNVQTSQIFMATHSPYIIESALNYPSNSIVYCFSINNGTTVVRKISAPFLLPVITTAELNYEVFRICSKDYHNELYGYIQKRFNTTSSILSTDKAIAASSPYDSTLHYKRSINANHPSTIYCTLPTYIRNLIDHPDYQTKITNDEIQKSILLLRKILETT